MATTTIYSVESTDGGITLVIQPRTFNGPNGVLRNTDLTLYGNATPNWGERFNQNFYRLNESYACEEKAGSPGVPQDESDLGDVGLGITFPVQGQTWYNKTDNRLYIQTTPTDDLDTVAANWEGLALSSEVDALSSGLGGVATNKVDRAGDLNLTGVHGYPALFFNEGNGAIAAGPDIRATAACLIAADDSIYLNIDGDNNGGGGFVVSKGSLVVNGSETRLLVVHNNGLMQQQIDATTYSGLVAGGSDQSIPNKKYVDDEITTATASSGLPPGVVLPYGGAAAPTNFLLCNGASHNSIASPQLAPLYATIGLTYGGSGPADFRVPDLRGRAPVGVGLGSFGWLGQHLGAETHNLTGAETGPHTHTATVTGSTDAVGNHNHGISWRSAEGGGGDNEIESWDGSQQGVTGPGGAHSHTITGAAVTVNSGGSGAAHNNIQPSIGLNFIISI